MKTIKNRALHRAKIIEGQVKNLVAMIEKDQYCVDIMTQSLAAQKALGSLNESVLSNHLQTCVVDQIKAGKKDESVKELISLYHLKNK